MRSIVSVSSLVSVLFAVPAFGQATPVPARTPASPATAPAGTRLVLLQGGTEFDVILTDSVSSRTAQVGDTVAMTVKKDVRLDGRVVIRRGAPATAIVSRVERPRRMGRVGHLDLGSVSTTSVDGQRVPLREATGERKNETGTTVALTALAGPLGLMRRGSEESVAAGSVMRFATDADVRFAFETEPGAVTARRGRAAPASLAYVPAPIKPSRASGFGVLDRFVGADVAGGVFRIQVGWDRESDVLTVSFAGVTGEPAVWKLAKIEDDPKTFSVVLVDAPRKSNGYVGRLLPDGTVHIVQTYGRSRYIRAFRADGPALVHEFGSVHEKDQEPSFLSPDYLYPVNARVLARLEEDRAESRRQSREAEAEERARRAEESARRAAQIQGAIQAVGEAVADGYAQQAAAREANAQAQREAAARREAAAERNAAAAREAAREAESTTSSTQAGAGDSDASTGSTQQGAMRTPAPRLRANPAGTSDSPSAQARAGEASRASTDTDANRCVTSAETRLNAAFQGNTSASVLNGCGQPVDVRICLMAEKTDGTRAWNCGVDYAVPSQGQATHSSFKATGEVFVDARITSSRKALAYPPGYR